MNNQDRPFVGNQIQRQLRSEIDLDAIIVAGGQAPMFSYDKNLELQQKFSAFYEAGKIACALCHGVSVLGFAKLSNGEYLAKGKTRCRSFSTRMKSTPFER